MVVWFVPDPVAMVVSPEKELSLLIFDDQVALLVHRYGRHLPARYRTAGQWRVRKPECCSWQQAQRRLRYPWRERAAQR